MDFAGAVNAEDLAKLVGDRDRGRSTLLLIQFADFAINAAILVRLR